MSDSLLARIKELEAEILSYRQVMTRAQEIIAQQTDSYYATKIVTKMIEEKLRLTPPPPAPSTSSSS